MQTPPKRIFCAAQSHDFLNKRTISDGCQWWIPELVKHLNLRTLLVLFPVEGKFSGDLFSQLISLRDMAGLFSEQTQLFRQIIQLLRFQ